MISIKRNAALWVLVSIGASSASIAQVNGGAGGGTSESGSDQLVEIVVTAQRRSEDAQNVPVSVTSLGTDELTKSNTTTGYDIQALVPGLTMSTSAGAVTPFIRGIGNAVTSAGNEAASSIYIDDVYIARVNPAELEFNNIERIDVLEGPQGTLFGRNSTGGLINIITPSPGTTPTLKADVGFANFNTSSASAYVAGPVSDAIGGSVSMIYRNQGEGWGRNLATGGQTWFDKYAGLRTKWVAKPSDGTKITISGDYLEDHQDLSLYQSAYPGTTLGNPPGYPPAVYPSNQGGSFYNTNVAEPAGEQDAIFGLSARLDQQLPFANLVDIMAYRHGKSDQSFNASYVPIQYFTADLLNNFDQVSEELQLVSKPESPVSWIVGLYALRLRDGYDPSFLGGTEFGGVAVAAYGEETTKSYAGFSQVTAPVAEATKLTLGVRYTIDDVFISGRSNILGPDGTTIEPTPEEYDSTRFSKVTWRAALDHKFTDNILGYVSASTGYKAGLYATLPVSTTPVLPETVNAYEIGTKTEFLDHRLRVNLAAYYYKVRDLQVQLLQGPSVQLLNAPKASTRGVDLNIDAVLTSHFSAHFAASYLDARYDDFPNAPATINPSRLVDGMVPGCTTPAVLPTPGNGGNTDFCSANISGNQIVRSPPVTATLTLDYTVPLSVGTLDIFASASYSSGFFWDPDNFLKQDAFVLVDSSVRYLMPNGHSWVRIWGKNLANEERFNGESEQSFNFGNPGSPAAPRTYGVNVGVQF
jgi:iron complex outermembrane recepter protein